MLYTCKAQVRQDTAVCVRTADRALENVEKSGLASLYLYNQRMSLCAREADAGDAGALDRAFRVLSRVVERGEVPDIVTFNTLLHVCAKSARTQGEEVQPHTAGIQQRKIDCGRLHDP